MTIISTDLNIPDLTVELRSADGSSTEFYQADESRVREALRLLSDPKLFSQQHLLLASQHCASMTPCKGIGMILVRTAVRAPLKFPLSLPAGQFDLVEQPEAWPDNESATIKAKNEPSRRRSAQVEVHTLGGWTVTVKVVVEFRGNTQDERQWFGHLPNVPTIPFRLKEGGFGLINTANIIRVSARPKPESLPGIALPLALRRWAPPQPRGHAIRTAGF